MDDNKKKIAAMTAVLYLLQKEEEAVLPDLSCSRPKPFEYEGFWSYSGRQSQMMLRSMAQMRLFPGWRG